MAKFKVGDKVKVVHLVLNASDRCYEYLDEYVNTLGMTGTIIGISHEPEDQHDPVYVLDLTGDHDGPGSYREYELVDPDQRILTHYEQAQEELARSEIKINEPPVLENRLRILSARFLWAAEAEHEKHAETWTIIKQSQQLAQMLYVDRRVE